MLLNTQQAGRSEKCSLLLLLLFGGEANGRTDEPRESNRSNEYELYLWLGGLVAFLLLFSPKELYVPFSLSCLLLIVPSDCCLFGFGLVACCDEVLSPVMMSGIEDNSICKIFLDYRYCTVFMYTTFQPLVTPIVQQRPRIRYSACTLQCGLHELSVIRESLCLYTIDRCSRRKESQTDIALPQP